MWSSKDGVKKQTMAWSTKWTPQGSDHSAIHTWNEHKDIQVNKHKARHLYAQHSTDTTTQGNCIKDIKFNKGYKSDVLKKMHNINIKY